ncbi:KAR9-domain-containing protein [Choiromyces venosus 120613-1]|uniref:KAR9-domain-containing protein n=1 Tax=Choiromyces venosus 120613-1 TaxID=1336337 RepID=A0A3N4JEQ6_9PEZI|nr:KAR9-domain-containing protein [Choiromyces venosus 120613-1]
MSRDRLSPSPSPHRKFSNASSNGSVSVAAAAITNGAALRLSKELPPTPVEDDEDDEEFHTVKGDGASKTGDNDDASSSDGEGAHNFSSALQSPNNQDGTFNHASIMMTSSSPPGSARPDTSDSTWTEDSRNAARFSNDISPETQTKTQTETQNNNSPYAVSSTILQRRASVFSLSRVSFSAQLSRLTSLSLPLSEDISSRIRQLPTAREACNALISAGDQISRWIDTAKKVLRGLDAEDDVEWAAQGRESLNEVDAAIGKFSSLVHVYVELIDELQNREDSDEVEKVLVEILKSMEEVMDGWNEVKVVLKGVKDQVETAMEWTELWTMILQDIQAELDACQTIVFEEEEKRHRSMMEDTSTVDLDALETIIEETPISALPKVTETAGEEESSLLGLMARMQPLRVSLDFLPMRLQSFQARAEGIFPSACEDLATRRNALEKKWKKLDSDVEGLKKELGEDKWVALFRNAGVQTANMMSSVERSLKKLRDAVTIWEESEGRIDNDLALKIQNYEAKKVHYGSAIERALGLITKGVRDRITVNGEIIRLDAAMRTRWKTLEDGMADMEQDMNDLGLNVQTLRDSLSSVTSLEVRSYGGSGIITPGSSPASSVVMAASPGGIERKRSPSSATKSPGGVVNTRPSQPRASSIPKKSQYARLSSTGSVAGASVRNSLSPITTGMIRVSSTPGAYQTSPTGLRSSSASSSSSKPADNRPRWNSSTNTSDSQFGHNFKPLTLTTPSPYRKNPPNTNRITSPTLSLPASPGASRIPGPSPLTSASLPGSPLLSGSRRSSGGIFLKSPSPAPRLAPAAGGRQHPELRRQASMSQLRHQSREQTRHASQESITSSTISHSTYVEEKGREREERQDLRDKENAKRSGNSRPASAMASARSNRVSMLPRPTTPVSGSGSGKRNSMPPGTTLAQQQAAAKADNKPRWRLK